MLVTGNLLGSTWRPYVQLNAHIEQGTVAEWMAVVRELLRIGISAQQELRNEPAVLLSAQQQFGDGGQLHVRGSLVDLADLGVTPVFLDRIVFGEAVAAV